MNNNNTIQLLNFEIKFISTLNLNNEDIFMILNLYSVTNPVKYVGHNFDIEVKRLKTKTQYIIKDLGRF